MVFIHGGGLTSGAATTYDFKDLATQGDLVVVSIQYRLSSMGWLAVPGAVAANNAGLWDQIAALRWVHDHIAGFGGDAARVTIFGQSAGGTSVLLLASSPPAKGLFARAIAESPWWASNQIGGAAPDVAADVIWGDCWCDVVNCSFTGDALGRELRAANATELVEACYVVAVVPDGVAVPAPLMDALCAGDADPFGDALDDPGFEMIVGSNHDEYRYWLMGVGNASATEADIADELVGYVGRNVLEMNLDLAVNRTLGWTERCRAAARDDLLRRIFAAYAGHSPFEHAVDFTTDFWFTVPTALAASTGTRARRARYLFQNDVEADTVMPSRPCTARSCPTLGFEGFVWRYNSSDEDAVRDYFHAPTKAMRETKVFTQDLWIDFATHGFHDDTWPAITGLRRRPDLLRAPKLREAYLRACLDGDFKLIGDGRFVRAERAAPR
ncbi:carboxylic ester hydrolase [Aureococcus anophagefferens]|nr:carboxylic ester hydrolase [Aureococcus anophagefferens]